MCVYVLCVCMCVLLIKAKRGRYAIKLISCICKYVGTYIHRNFHANKYLAIGYHCNL